MLFLVLLAVGAAIAAPVQHLYVLTDPTPPGSYVIVEPVPEAPAFPPLHYGIANEDKKGFAEIVPAERSAPEEDDANNAKPDKVDADDAPPPEGDANNTKPEEDDNNENRKSEDDDANDAKPEASENHDEQSQPEKPISPEEIKVPPPLEQAVKPLVIRLEDPAPSLISWLPFSIPAFQFPSIPGLSGLSLPSLPNLSSFNIPGLSNLNLPSISNFNLSNLSNFNIPGLSSIFGSSPQGSRYIVYRSY